MPLEKNLKKIPDGIRRMKRVVIDSTVDDHRGIHVYGGKPYAAVHNYGHPAKVEFQFHS